MGIAQIMASAPPPPDPFEQLMQMIQMIQQAQARRQQQEAQDTRFAQREKELGFQAEQMELSRRAQEGVERERSEKRAEEKWNNDMKGLQLAMELAKSKGEIEAPPPHLTGGDQGPTMDEPGFHPDINVQLGSNPLKELLGQDSVNLKVPGLQQKLAVMAAEQQAQRPLAAGHEIGGPGAGIINALLGKSEAGEGVGVTPGDVLSGPAASAIPGLAGMKKAEMTQQNTQARLAQGERRLGLAEKKFDATYFDKDDKGDMAYAKGIADKAASNMFEGGLADALTAAERYRKGASAGVLAALGDRIALPGDMKKDKRAFDTVDGYLNKLERLMDNFYEAKASNASTYRKGMEAKALKGFIEASAAQVVKSFGDRGRLSDQDLIRALEALPGYWSMFVDEEFGRKQLEILRTNAMEGKERYFRDNLGDLNFKGGKFVVSPYDNDNPWLLELRKEHNLSTPGPRSQTKIESSPMLGSTRTNGTITQVFDGNQWVTQ